MALEDLTGADKFVGNLVITNPLSADDRREGDDHIRGIKNVLKNSFPTLAGPVNFGNYVLKTGDTMTGDLTLAGASGGALLLNKAAAGATQNSIFGRRGGQDRWRLDLGESTAEAAGNVGSDYRLLSFDNAGAYLKVVYSISRADGTWVHHGNGTVVGTLNVNGGVTVTGLTVNGVASVSSLNAIGGVTATSLNVNGAASVTGVCTMGSSSGCVGDFSVRSRTITGGGGSNGQYLVLMSGGGANGSLTAGAFTGDPAVTDLQAGANLAIYIGGTIVASYSLPGGAGDAQYLCLTQRVKMPNILGVAAGSNIYIEQGDQNRFYKVTSSLRYKKNVEPMQRTEMIYELEPIWFRMKVDHLGKGRSYYGFGAEDVAAVDPRLAHWSKDEQGRPIPEGVQYDRIIVPVVAELKKLRARIEALESGSVAGARR